MDIRHECAMAESVAQRNCASALTPSPPRRTISIPKVTTVNVRDSPRPAVVAGLEELCRNANIGKYRHFSAAARAKRLNDCLGVPVVVINVVLGSVFFITISQDIPDLAKWAGGFLGLAGALVSGVSTFFNFGKLFEGHRAIANKYVALAGKCTLALARYQDGLIDLGDIDRALTDLSERYADVNDEAKAYATTARDFKSALHSEVLRVQTLADRKNDASEHA